MTFLLLTSAVKADEGMWLLPLLKQLNEADMQELGLKPAPLEEVAASAAKYVRRSSSE